MLWWLFRLFKGYVRIHIKKHQSGIFSGKVQDKRGIHMGTGVLDKGSIPVLSFLKMCSV